MPADDLLLPEGSVLLHIGPFKTGTTAIQTAIREAAPALKEHGVTVIGPNRRNVRRAVLSLTNNRGLSGDAPPSAELWRKLVRQINRVKTPRAVLSSEFLCDASPAAIAQVVEAIGRDRVHVVVTVRPLAKILPSAWQQYVRNMLKMPYDDWLDSMFNRAPYQQPTPSFWRRHRHGKLVARWVDEVGADRVSVVIADDQEREGLSRAFEGLLGLPEGMLAAPPTIAGTNRSLTAAEIELVRQLNLQFAEHDWPAEVYHKFVRNSVVARLLRRTPEPDEPRIVTPLWAQEQAAAAAQRSVARFNHLGVRVIGNPDSLALIEPPPADTGRRADLPVSATVGIIVALLYRSGLIVPPTEIVAEIDDVDETDVGTAERRARQLVRRWRRWRTGRRALKSASKQSSKVMPEPGETT